MAARTRVELVHYEGRVEHWLRFGRHVEEEVLDRRRRVLSFDTDQVFAFVRWASNDYGTAVSRIGETGCRGQSVPMDKLDEAVIQHIEWRLLDPRRLEALMNELLERRHQWAESRRTHVAEMRRRASEAEARLHRLYQLIESGAASPSEPVLAGRLAELNATRDQAHADADRAEATMEKADSAVTPETLRAFALAARKRLRNEDGTYRRDHLRALAQRVEVEGDAVRIMGSKTELLRTLIACAGVGSAEFRVRGLIPKWRPIADEAENYVHSVAL